MGDGADRLVVGRYRLIELLGRGGMGAVWRARDEGLDREVVVKQLTLPDHLDAQQRRERYARMQREARAAARLKHPGIITIHDQVVEEDGRPWIVMEIIHGRSLDDVVKAQGRLPIRQVAHIGVQMLAALAAAHAAGITHRDVKPANVLLEGDRVVLTDFGIAAVDGDVTLTGTGVALGTPAFMSPEQINGRPATAASDLWSLGATLYAAAEGRRPYTAPTPGALYAAITTRPPDPPVHAGPLTPVLTGLMHKDPAQRLTNDQAMRLLTTVAAETSVQPSPSSDNTRSDLPATTRAPQTRSRLYAIVLLAIVAALVAIGTVVTYLVRPPPGGQVTAIAQLTGHSETVESVAFSPDGKTLASGGDGVRLWDAAAHGPIGSPLTGHTSTVHSVAFSPDGKTLASGSLDGTIILWDVQRRARIGGPVTAHTESVESVTFSPDGKTLAGASRDETIRLWDVANRRPIGDPLTGHTFQVYSIAFSPDGRILASGSGDKTIRLWDVANRRPIGNPLTGHTDYVRSVAFSPDGELLAGGGNDNTVRLWDVATREPAGLPLTGHTNFVSSVAFSPDGSMLAAGDNAGQLWDVRTRRRIGDRFTGHTDSVYSIAFSPDGKTLATGSADHTVRLWSTAGVGPRTFGRARLWLTIAGAAVAGAAVVAAGAIVIRRRRRATG